MGGHFERVEYTLYITDVIDIGCAGIDGNEGPSEGEWTSLAEEDSGVYSLMN